MTTGPNDGKCGTPAGGPGGMPAALRLNEGLGITGRDVRGVCESCVPARLACSQPCVLAGLIRR
jgi:hypothetical protein